MGWVTLENGEHAFVNDEGELSIGGKTISKGKSDKPKAQISYKLKHVMKMTGKDGLPHGRKEWQSVTPSQARDIIGHSHGMSKANYDKLWNISKKGGFTNLL